MMIYTSVFDCLCIHWLSTRTQQNITKCYHNRNFPHSGLDNRTSRPSDFVQTWQIVAWKLASCWQPNSFREEVMIPLVPFNIIQQSIVSKFRTQTIAMFWVALKYFKTGNDWHLNCANAKGLSKWISILRLVRMLVSTENKTCRWFTVTLRLWASAEPKFT